MNKERMNRVLQEMKRQQLPQLIVSDQASIAYLTGQSIDPGERLVALIIREDGHHVAVINRLFPISEESLGMPIIFVDDTDKGMGVLTLAKELDSNKPIAVEKNWAAHFLLDIMKELDAPISQYTLSSNVIDKVRAIKTEEEIERMLEASHDNDLAMNQLIGLIPEKLTELAMAERLEKIYHKLGNDGFSFEPIVAYGANGADPHHMNDESVVKPGDSIILDIGGVKNGYCSDMTRTVFYKEVSDKSRDVYETVLEANKRAIDTVKPGARLCDIDAAARDYIDSKGYGEYFTHRTGHFIGTEVHEAGDVSASNTDIVEEGMIFSIEPGIYISGEVGVRIEDLVVVTKNGCQILNEYPKELIVID
ncbi:M24 family metallopeptidase [Vagococcus bubulae]|uniref:Peptidase M24 family protein n=1 Tax=Vagococcus bubulae TaxID=1977868 RepID=A0A429ZQ83_9ENTE|nr:aminopeptidase P family protein [Vagococcus bubulae]RST95874.1 peptidase M24 family protein [Vagococcus bubulae]